MGIDLAPEYKVRLDVFEGPLDLLLYLIKRNEVDIYEVSIEQITQEYLEYLSILQTCNVELAGDFIVMAATLLYIKSRTLLPKDLQLAVEEEEEDPQWELIRQLLEYKKFKEASSRLKEWASIQEELFPRMPAEESPLPPETLLVEEMSVFDLVNAFQGILKRFKNKREDVREIFAENFTVGEKMEAIVLLMKGQTSLRFDELFSLQASRTEVVATFLAMLELIRMKRLQVRQDSFLGEIWIDACYTEQMLFPVTP